MALDTPAMGPQKPPKSEALPFCITFFCGLQLELEEALYSSKNQKSHVHKTTTKNHFGPRKLMTVIKTHFSIMSVKYWMV